MDQIQVCRTCLNVIRKPSLYVSLEGITAKSKEIKTKLEDCIPEMTISTVKNPVICGRCLISLNASYEFRRKCTATEEEVYKYLFDTEGDVVDLKCIANQDYIDPKSYCNNKSDVELIIYKTENDEINCKTENDSESFSIKEEIDCDFEATDYVCSEQFYNMPEIEKNSTAENENTNGLLNSSVVLDNLPSAGIDDKIQDNSNNVKDFNNEIENINNKILQKDLNKERINNSKKLYTKLKKVDTSYVYVLYPYNSTTAEPMRITKQKKVDDNEKTYKCGICNVSSTIRLSIHMRKHTGEKPYKCHICRYASANSSHLKIHMKKHSEKKFPCCYCEFCTDTRLKLKIHVNNHHPGYKIHKCKDCEYSTDSLKNIKCHAVSHTDKPLYECANCSYKTWDKRILKKHIYKHMLHMKKKLIPTTMTEPWI